MMNSEKTLSNWGGLLALLFAAILAFCLTGCGDQSAASSSSAEPSASEEAAESSATGDEVAIPDDVTAISDTVKGIAKSGDVEGADDIDALPKREVAADEELEAPEVQSADDDASKYSGDLVLVRQGGVQMAVPASWQMGTQEDGLVMATPAGDVVCVVSSYPKAPNETVPLEALAKVTPTQLANKGLNDVQVINYGTNYSEAGTLCTSFVFCSGTANGTEYYVYDQFVDSKNYVNLVELVAPASAFKANFDAINTVTDSLRFAPGEEI